MEKEEVQGPEEEEDPKVQKLRSNSVWKKKKDGFFFLLFLSFFKRLLSFRL